MVLTWTHPSLARLLFSPTPLSQVNLQLTPYLVPGVILLFPILNYKQFFLPSFTLDLFPFLPFDFLLILHPH